MARPKLDIRHINVINFVAPNGFNQIAELDLINSKWSYRLFVNWLRLIPVSFNLSTLVS